MNIFDYLTTLIVILVTFAFYEDLLLKYPVALMGCFIIVLLVMLKNAEKEE